MAKSRTDKLSEMLMDLKDSQVGRFARQAKQGISLGFADELQDVIGAGLGSAFSDYTYKELLDTARQMSKDELAKDWEESPVTSFAGQVVGGIPLGLGKAGAAATNWIRSGSALQGIGRGAAVGAGYGSLAGAGAADDTLADRAAGFGLGAGAGAVLGGATAPLARLGQPNSNVDYRKVTNKVVKGQESKAAQELARQLAARPDLKDQLSRAEGMAAASQRTGIPLTLAEMIAQNSSDPLLAQQAVLGSKPMTAGQMANMYAARSGTPQQAGQIEQSLLRMAQQLDPTVGSYDEAARSLIGAGDEAVSRITKNLVAQASPLYEQAYAKKVAPNQLKAITNNQPIIENAIKAAYKDERYAAKLSGKPQNSIEVIDAAKRIIDEKIRAGSNPMQPFDTKAYKEAQAQLLGLADKYAPSYSQARSIYSGNPEALQMRQQIGGLADIDQMDARSVNRALFGGTQQNAEVAAQALGQKAPAAAAARIYDAMDAARGDPVTLAGRIAPDQRTSDMLRTYAGQNAAPLEETLNVINQAKLGERMRNGSPTQPRMEAEKGLETAANAAVDVVTGGKTTLLRRVANMFARGNEEQDPQFYADMADLMLTPKGLDLVRRVASGQQNAIQELQQIGIPSLIAGKAGGATTTLPFTRAGIGALIAPETQTPTLNAATQQDFSDIEAILRGNAAMQKQQDFSDIEKILQGVR